MSDFKAKMHQIQFRLGLRPRPYWELIALPQTFLLHLGAMLLTEMGKRNEVRGRGEGKENGIGREGRPPRF